MEVCCSFKSLAGGICGFDTRERGHGDRVVPLLSCSKDVANHLLAWSFSGPQNEIDLLLCRAGIFKKPDSIQRNLVLPWLQNLKKMTVMLTTYSLKLLKTTLSRCAMQQLKKF